jgi:cobalt-zinc-cadmium efflux system outer membrane protein
MIDLALARDRARWSATAAAELEEIRRISDSRLRAGDISELEARTAAIDATRARQESIRAQGDVIIREHAVRAKLGLALQTPPVALVSAPAGSDACRDRPGLLDEALASRPDVRAAEIGVEAAAARLGWEKSRVMTFSAVLDANGAGKEGFEMGPGIDVSIPIFDRNQGGRARGTVELQRASLAYSGARQRVAADLNEALALLAQARAMRDGWREAVITPLERQVEVAQRAFAAGDISYLAVLEMTRRLTDARLRAAETDADVARAAARLERAVGRPCNPKGPQS